jgi:hypothetical protein
LVLTYAPISVLLLVIPSLRRPIRSERLVLVRVCWNRVGI